MPSHQHAAPLPATLAALTAFVALALAAGLAAPAAHAQYKWVGADGRVNYTDQPPSPDSRRLMRTATAAPAPGAPAATGHSLPHALRSAMSRYPVVLYSTNDCAPCELGRSQLTQRGVPFTERPVRTAADVRAFNALQFGTSQFPVLTVGTDRMVGFEPTQWNQMLDAAAYPRSSMLPASYLARTLEPMSPPEQVSHAAEESGRAPAVQTAQSGADTANPLIPAQRPQFRNPIRF